MSVLLFLLVLFVLILVHEWGHFITAKKTGMRVDEFGIGFPPRLFRWRKGETDYSLNLLPIGGFVKIFGENGVDDLSALPEAERARAFGARPKWAQALVLIAGVTMNMLLAWVLFTVTFMVGMPTEVDETTATDNAMLMVVGTLPDSPASVLPYGSEITAVTSGDQSLTSLSHTELSTFVGEVAPAPLLVTYTYAGETNTVEITPAQGLTEEDSARYIIGAQTALVENVSLGPVAAVVEGAKRTYTSTIAIAIGLVTFLKQAIVGTADYSQVSGPIGIVGMVGDAAKIGLVTLLNFTAFISLNLAVINLLPVPALDGGRLLFVAIEAITRKQIPPAWAGYLNLAGFVLLIALMLAVTYSDITKLIT